MKAEERNDATPSQHGIAQPPAPHGHEATVGEGIGDLFAAVKSSAAVNPRVIGLLLAAGMIGGAWWFYARATKQADSARWTDLERLTGVVPLEDFANENKGTVPGKIARLEETRRLFGANGVARLSNRDARADGLKNVEKARDEFVKLADEFAKDETMRAECLRNAAEAELALVGVPKDGGGSRGTVEAAVGYLRAVATTVGPDTTAGQAATKKAESLEKNAADVSRVGQLLNSQMTPMPIPDIKAPPSLAPSAPSAPIETPKPPTGPLMPPAPPSPAPPAPPATGASAPVVPPPVVPPATKK